MLCSASSLFTDSSFRACFVQRLALYFNDVKFLFRKPEFGSYKDYIAWQRRRSESVCSSSAATVEQDSKVGASSLNFHREIVSLK